MDADRIETQLLPPPHIQLEASSTHKTREEYGWDGSTEFEVTEANNDS